MDDDLSALKKDVFGSTKVQNWYLFLKVELAYICFECYALTHHSDFAFDILELNFEAYRLFNDLIQLRLMTEPLS